MKLFLSLIILSVCLLVIMYICSLNRCLNPIETFLSDPLTLPVSKIFDSQIDILKDNHTDIIQQINDAQSNIIVIGSNIIKENYLYNKAVGSSNINTKKINTLDNRIKALNNKINEFNNLFEEWKASHGDDILNSLTLENVTSSNLENVKTSFENTRSEIVIRLQNTLNILKKPEYMITNFVNKITIEQMNKLIELLQEIDVYYTKCLEIFKNVSGVDIDEKMITNNWVEYTKHACTSTTGVCWLPNDKIDGGLIRKNYGYVYDIPEDWLANGTTCTRNVNAELQDECLENIPILDDTCNGTERSVYQIKNFGNDPRDNTYDSATYTHFPNVGDVGNFDSESNVICTIDFKGVKGTDYYLSEETAKDISSDNCHKNGVYGVQRFSCWGIKEANKATLLDVKRDILPSNTEAVNLGTYSKQWSDVSKNNNIGLCVPNDTCRTEEDLKAHIDTIKSPNNWKCFETKSIDDLTVLQENTNLYKRTFTTGLWNINTNDRSESSTNVQETCRTLEDVQKNVDCLKDNHFCYTVDDANNTKLDDTKIYKTYSVGETNDVTTMKCSTDDTCISFEDANKEAKSNCMNGDICYTILPNQTTNGHELHESLTISPIPDASDNTFVNGFTRYYNENLELPTCIVRNCDQEKNALTKTELCSKQQTQCYIRNTDFIKTNKRENSTMVYSESKDVCEPLADCIQIPFCSYQKVLTNSDTRFDPSDINKTDCSNKLQYGKKYEWLLETNHNDSVTNPSDNLTNYNKWTSTLTGDNLTCVRDESIVSNHLVPQIVNGENDETFVCACDDDKHYELKYFREPNFSDNNGRGYTEKDLQDMCKDTDCADIPYYSAKVKTADNQCIGDDQIEKSANTVGSIKCNNVCQTSCLSTGNLESTTSTNLQATQCFAFGRTDQIPKYVYVSVQGELGTCTSEACGTGTSCTEPPNETFSSRNDAITKGWRAEETYTNNCPVNFKSTSTNSQNKQKQYNVIYKKDFADYTHPTEEGCVPYSGTKVLPPVVENGTDYCPEDCVYNYTEWGQCVLNQSGSSKQTRTVQNFGPFHNGSLCDGNTILEETCIFPSPPVLSENNKVHNAFTCNFIPGSNGGVDSSRVTFVINSIAPSANVVLTANEVRVTNCAPSTNYTLSIKKMVDGVAYNTLISNVLSVTTSPPKIGEYHVTAINYQSLANSMQRNCAITFDLFYTPETEDANFTFWWGSYISTGSNRIIGFHRKSGSFFHEAHNWTNEGPKYTFPPVPAEGEWMRVGISFSNNGRHCYFIVNDKIDYHIGRHGGDGPPATIQTGTQMGIVLYANSPHRLPIRNISIYNNTITTSDLTTTPSGRIAHWTGESLISEKGYELEIFPRAVPGKRDPWYYQINGPFLHLRNNLKPDPPPPQQQYEGWYVYPKSNYNASVIERIWDISIDDVLKVGLSYTNCYAIVHTLNHYSYICTYGTLSIGSQLEGRTTFVKTSAILNK
jgi:hypothetical protein